MREKFKLKQFEKRISKLQESSSRSLKTIPEKWEDFVSLTTIRSGGKMVRFTPYPYQILLSRLMDEYSNIVVVKSR